MKLWVCLSGLACCLYGTVAMGNQVSVPVWRCGNLYTNQPQPDQSCESVTISTLEETQVPQPSKPAPASVVAPAVPASAGKPPPPRVDAVAQRERDGQAKDILSHELKRLNERCQAATDTQTVQRCAADQAALKRELSRLP
jgi:hypothetical protein